MKAQSHEGPIARLEQLKGTGTIYLVQVGKHRDPYSLDDFAGWLHSKYALDVRVLPPMAFEKSTWDSSRKQYVAELLYQQIKDAHPDLAADPHAYLIGFTDGDMFSVWYKWSSSFTQRDRQRAAIISSDGMQDDLIARVLTQRDGALERFHARLQRILLKDVGMLYWHIPTNNDPTSIFHQTLDPDVPTEDVYESDLAPELTKWGRAEGEPCLFFSYSKSDGVKPLPGDLLRGCGDVELPSEDDSVELIQVDLRLGLLILRHTEFNLPGSMPIQFERALRDGWPMARGFGVSGTDNYDSFLYTPNADVNINLARNDGGTFKLVRAPRPFWIFSPPKWVDAEYSGRSYEMRRPSNPTLHFELRRFDGEVQSFFTKEPNNPSALTCYLNGVRRPDGKEVKFERDANRQLVKLTSPNADWLYFEHGPGGRFSVIRDNHGRNVHYSYDEKNRLTAVSYSTGEVLHYVYDNEGHILTLGAESSSGDTRIVLRNEYKKGLLTKQTLEGGQSYQYSYRGELPDRIRNAGVRMPDGRLFEIEVSDNNSTIFELESTTSIHK